MNEDREDREFQQREAGYSDTMGALISSFGQNVVKAHHELQMSNAQYIQTLAAMENLRWAVEIGILTMDQALTLMANIPIFTVVDTDPFVFTEASLDMEMRVSAHREDTSKLKVGTEVKTEASVGGIAALVGGGGGISIKADTTYQKDTRRESDYSSTVKAHIKMERVDAPEGVQLIRDTTNEVVRVAMQINQDIIKNQAAQLTSEVETADLPQSLPEGILESDSPQESTAGE